MDNRVKFYSWLIGLLDSAHLTFEEIADEWKEARVNQNKDAVSYTHLTLPTICSV